MYADHAKRLERAQFAPLVILCESCDGQGTRLVQTDKCNWYLRSTVTCEACQRTGLKGIPESEVNEVRAK
jgi:hypothetical protein